MDRHHEGNLGPRLHEEAQCLACYLKHSGEHVLEGKGHCCSLHHGSVGYIHQEDTYLGLLEAHETSHSDDQALRLLEVGMYARVDLGQAVLKHVHVRAAGLVDGDHVAAGVGVSVVLRFLPVAEPAGAFSLFGIRVKLRIWAN